MRLNVFNSLMGLCVATAAVSCSDGLVEDNLRPVGSESDMISFVVANESNATRGGSLGNRPCGGAILHSANGADSLFLNVEVDDFTCDPATRATLSTSNSFFFTGNKFAVFGNKKKTDSPDELFTLFNNVGVTCQGDGESAKWTYDNLRYWFPDYTYSFVAMYPASVSETLSSVSNLDYSGNSLSFTYTTPQDYTKISDLMTATESRIVTSSSDVPVNIDFHHILSRINFKFKVDASASSDVVIKKLTLSNVPTSANYSITPSEPDNELINDFVENWTNLTVGSENPFDFIKKQGENDVNYGITINKGTTYEFFPDATYDEGGTVVQDGNVLLVIPHEISNTETLTISYNTVGSTSDDITVNVPLKDLTASHGYEWAIGKSYTYTLSFEPDIQSDIEIVDLPEFVDAHYVIAKATVNNPKNVDWKLKVEIEDQNTGELKPSIVKATNDTYKKFVNFYEEGYWLDIENDSGDSARGTETETGGPDDTKLYIFIPENVLDTDRKIKINLVEKVNDEEKVILLNEITQLCPAWDGNIGAERIQDGGDYPWAYTENSENIPKFYFNMSQCPDKALYDVITGYYKHDRFKNIVNSSGGGPDKNGAPGKWIVDITISGYQGFTDLKINNSSDGKSNTWELIDYEGFSDVIALIDLLEAAGGKAYQEKNSTNTPIEDPRGLVGGNMKHNAAYACVKKNRHVVDFKGESFAPMLKEEDLVWFLPAQEEAQYMKAIPNDIYYWTSTAVINSNSAYKFKLGGVTLSELRTTNLPVRACRKKD